MPHLPEPRTDFNIGDRISDLSLLLRATQPEGYDEYYNTRSPLLGKELSIGVLDKTDMMANDYMCMAILELFNEGQIDFAWDFMTNYQNDWKASMSIDGKLLDRLTSQEIKYSHTQTLHEYEHPVAKKKGLFSRLSGDRSPQEEE
jgi:hypothetical protein